MDKIGAFSISPGPVFESEALLKYCDSEPQSRVACIGHELEIFRVLALGISDQAQRIVWGFSLGHNLHP